MAKPLITTPLAGLRPNQPPLRQLRKVRVAPRLRAPVTGPVLRVPRGPRPYTRLTGPRPWRVSVALN